jgi:vacuolar-type H+-ATPase subunit E/Vma4
MTLNLRLVDSSTGLNPPLAGGILKASTLAAVDSARDLLDEARREAAGILEEARAEAQSLAQAELREREETLSRREAELEQAMWKRAASFTDAVVQEWEKTLADVESHALRLVGRALTRLIEEVPAELRLRACIKELLALAGRPDTGVLWVSKDDHAFVAGLDHLPWPVEASNEMATGSVRLVCAKGRWECDVAGALDRLLEAFDAGGDEAVEPPSQMEFKEEKQDDYPYY